MAMKPGAIELPVSCIQHSNAIVTTTFNIKHFLNVIRNQLPLSLCQHHAANTTTAANIHHHHSPTVTASEFLRHAPSLRSKLERAREGAPRLAP